VLEQPHPAYFLPLDHLPAGVDFSGNNIMVRVDPARLALVEREVRAAILREFPGGIPSIKAMDARLEPQYRPWRLGASLFTAFGLLALAVALVGVYSTVAYSVNHRLHEFGVRIALGATLRNVIALVLMQGLRVVATGIVVGVAVAVMAGRLIAGLLYGVTPSDPGTLALVSFVLLGVAAIATFVPAWRAARVDPASTLRTE
jgi:ABC-type antimicrobial peptide transport system permease subunit